MAEKTTIYLVNHTHWDREWYFSGQDSLVLSDLLFTNAIQELEKHSKMSFVLDGQLSIVEDYLKVRPEMTERLKNLVTKGQLKIGPWYTQPDALHVKGESLLRNGIVGKLKAAELGPVMKVGYLPDTFGFNSQLPVILNDLGLKNFVFWRGIDPKKTGSFYFNWQSLGGKKFVTAVNMPQGYGTGMLLEPTHKYVDDRLDAAVDFIEDHSPAEEKRILIPTGNDQMDIIHDFEDKVDKINGIGKFNYKISTYSDFIKDIESEKRTKYVGEFIDPIFARIHRSCGSSRMNIKLAASHLENKLINQVEPLMVIGIHCGIDLSSGVLVSAWKNLLKSQAHDSMAGSVVDSVAVDILERLKEGNEIADSIINTIQRLISLNLKLTDQQVLLLNPMAMETSAYQKIRLITAEKDVSFNDVEKVAKMHQEYIEPRENVLQEVSSGQQYVTEHGYYVTDYLVKTNLPALGYKILSFHKGASIVTNQNSEKLSISSAKIKLSFEDQSLILTLKDGTQICDFLYLEDRGNAGDTYDFSPLTGDKKIIMSFDTAESTNSGDLQQLILKGQVKLPQSIQERQLNKFNAIFKYTVKLMLTKDDQIKVQVTFRNNIGDHQLSLAINTGLTEPARASVPFGYITRQHHDQAEWQNKYAEKPINYWAFDDNVTVFEKGKYSMSIFSNDVKEYRQNDDRLLLTLLATTDELGKPDLVNRPGRASGDTTKVGHPQIETPDAELFQNFEFHFDVWIADKFDELKVAKKSLEISGEALDYQLQHLNLFENRLDNKLQDSLAPHQELGNVLSLLKTPNDLIISACYPDYFEKNAVIVRLSNPTQRTVKYEVAKNIVPVNSLDERIKFDGKIAPYDILTLRVPTTEDLSDIVNK